MEKYLKTAKVDCLVVLGHPVAAAKAGTSGSIRVLAYDRDGDVLQATGTDVPADTTTGYAKGCLFIDTNVGSGTTGLYVNVGTNTSSVFKTITNA